MLSFLTTATLLATTLSSLVSAAPLVSRQSSGRKSQIVTYYGQSAGQGLLDVYCDDPNIDIIPIAFVNGFPNQGTNGAYPSANFGDQCGGNAPGTNMFANCYQMIPGIQDCQAKGKKVLISIGGDPSSGYSLAGDDAGVYFANIMWSVFGPQASNYTGPRPFGSVVVDGFDFDIEGGNGSGYGAMANQLRTLMDAYKPGMILTAAPQCIVPDANLADALTKARFDHVYVQFYNTPYCSARTGVNYANNGNTGNDMTFDSWVNWIQSNIALKNWPQVFIGLPGSPTAVSDADQYLNAHDAKLLLSRFFNSPMFGGVMLWDAGNARNNPDGNYVTTINNILVALNGGASTTTSSTLTSSSTSSSTVSSSASSAVTTTSSQVLTATSGSVSTISSTVSTSAVTSSTSSVTTITSSQVSTTETASVSTSSSAVTSSATGSSVVSSSAISTIVPTNTVTTISSGTTASATVSPIIISPGVSSASVSSSVISSSTVTATTVSSSGAATTALSSGVSTTTVTSTTSIPITTTMTTNTASGGIISSALSGSSGPVSSASATLITTSISSNSESSSTISFSTSNGSIITFDPSSTIPTTSTQHPFGSITFTTVVSGSTLTSTFTQPTFGGSTIVSATSSTTTSTVQTSPTSPSSSWSSGPGGWGSWPVGSTTTSSKPSDPTTSSGKHSWEAWSTTSSKPSDPSSSTTSYTWSAWTSVSTKPADPATSTSVQSWSAWQGKSSKSTTSKPTMSTKPADPKSSVTSWGPWPSNVYVTTTTTVYTDVCPTGFTKITGTITATVTVTDPANQPTGKYFAWPTGSAGVPAGFYVSSAVCSVGCGDGPATVVVTVPIPSIVTKTVVPTQATPAADTGKPSSATWSVWSSSTPAAVSSTQATPAADTGKPSSATWSTWSSSIPVAAATGKVSSSGSAGLADPASPSPVASTGAKVSDASSTKTPDAVATGNPIGGYGDSPIKVFTGGAAADQAPATVFSVAVCLVLAIAGLVL